MIHLVLGGAGFIGQHLTHRLLRDPDNRVVVIDNLATSSFNPEDFAHYGTERFVSFFLDINDFDDSFLIHLFQNVDKIYHLAGSVGVEYIDKNPAQTMFNNMKLASKLIPLFEEVQKPVVFSSTSEIYGEGPFHEEANASIGPSSKLRWGYASAKLMTEFMIRASTFPHTIVRFFNVVGQGQLGTYGMVLPRFIEAAKNNTPLTIYGSGEQVRSFCHISDALDALTAVSSISGELFNIGNDTPTTINELAERVIKLTNSQSQIVYVPYEEAFSKHHGDINCRIPDLTKLKNTTGYTPKFTLDDIIRSMV